MGKALAGRGDLGRQKALSANPTPLLLASTSPQRRAILTQLQIPFEVAAPDYEEHDSPNVAPVELARAHALGKTRSCLALAAGRPLVGVDTAVVLPGGELYGKPADKTEARLMLARLAGRTHEVVSGLCLIGDGWEELEHEVTRVSFRRLSEQEIARYVSGGEWHGRAGAYAIQGLGAALVERIEGDYLNVVGLPVALLVRLLAKRYPGVYGFG